MGGFWVPPSGVRRDRCGRVRVACGLARPRGGAAHRHSPAPLRGIAHSKLFSRSASRSQRHFSSTQAPAPLPHPAAQLGVAEEGDDAVGGLLGGAAPDDPARLAVEDRVRGAAGIAGDDGQAGRRGLQVDDAEALDVEAAAPGPARHREDVPGAVVGGQLGPGHGTGEAYGGGDAGLLGESAQIPLVRAAPDDQQNGVRLGGQDPGHGPDQGVLSLAPHQPGHAHDDRPVRQTRAAPGPRRRPSPGGRSSRRRRAAAAPSARPPAGVSAPAIRERVYSPR